MTAFVIIRRSIQGMNRTRRPAGLVLGLLLGISASQADPLANEQEEPGAPETILELIDQSRDRLEALQREHGNFDTATLDALANLIELHFDSGNLQQAESTLDNQLEIIRINEGLHSAEQIPVLETQLRLRAARGDLDGVADTLHHMSWLYRRTDSLDVESRLTGVDALRDWTLALLHADSRDRQATHILSYRDLSQQLEELAEETHAGEDSATRMAYTYQAGKADLLTALNIVHNPLTGQELISRMEGIHSSALPPGRSIRSTADLEAVYGPRVNTVWERSFRNHMMRHSQRLESLQELAEEQEDAEAVAMLELYLGDALLLRQQFELRPGTVAGPRRGRASTGSATAYYERAHEQLLAAGHPAEDINQRFACPALLPLDRLYTRLEDYPICEQVDGQLRLPQTQLLQPGISGFSEIDRQNLRFGEEESREALLQFRVLRNGQVSAPEMLETGSDRAVQTRLLRELRELQFRPALFDGRPVVAENVVMPLRSY